MLLATFKHISSKNADYSAAEAYLTFEHDEFTMKPTLDENGRLIPRQDYRIFTLNCGDEDFAIACLRANLRYGKNQKREDVKSHHYIISFDPKDVPDHGLTVDLAQSLGEKFCKEHFPGHQAIVCTHPGGHNGSGILTIGHHALSQAYWKSRNTLVTWSTSKPASSRTEAKRNSKTLPINGRFSRTPMKPLLTKKPLPVCRNFARTNADPPEQARPICSPVSSAVPIAVRNCTTVPATVLKPDKITSYALLPVKRQGSLRYTLHPSRSSGRRYAPTHEVGNPMCC